MPGKGAGHAGPQAGKAAAKAKAKAAKAAEAGASVVSGEEKLDGVAQAADFALTVTNPDERVQMDTDDADFVRYGLPREAPAPSTAAARLSPRGPKARLSRVLGSFGSRLSLRKSGSSASSSSGSGSRAREEAESAESRPDPAELVVMQGFRSSLSREWLRDSQVKASPTPTLTLTQTLAQTLTQTQTQTQTQSPSHLPRAAVVYGEDNVVAALNAVDSGSVVHLRLAAVSNEIVSQVAATLSDGHGRGHSIAKLSISSVDGVCVDALEDLWAAISSVSTLDMSMCRMDDAVVESLVGAVVGLGGIEALEFRMCALSPQQSCRVLGILDEAEVGHLDLSGNDVDAAVSDALASALQHNAERGPWQLSLRSCSIDDGSCRELARSLRFAHSLRRLDLSGNGLGPASCKALAKALGSRRHPCALEALDLSYNPIGQDGCDHLCAMLRDAEPAAGGAQLGAGAGALKELDLRSCDVGLEGAYSLAAVLEANCTLTTLTVGGRSLRLLLAGADVSAAQRHSVEIGGEGAARLFEVLRCNDTLTSLNIAHPCLSAEGAALVQRIAATPMHERAQVLRDDVELDLDLLSDSELGEGGGGGGEEEEEEGNVGRLSRRGSQRDSLASGRDFALVASCAYWLQDSEKGTKQTNKMPLAAVPSS